MKNKAQLILLILLAGVQWAFAQDRTISGTITDTDGEPLIGATVSVLGATTGTATDIDGSYRIDVPEGSETLLVSYVGYLSKEVSIGASNVIDVQLEQDIAKLEEVVVIGYGSRKKRDITASVSQLESEEIAKSVTLSPEFALQGKTPGVQVQLASGDPNDRPTIRIRGVNTLGFNDPLIVIDGVPVAEFGAGAVFGTSTAAANDIRGTQNILNLINPDDIASISVLKDAAATAIYGLRASNGVILIETKRGQGVQQKAQVNLSAKRGVRNVRETYDVLPTSEYVALMTEQYNNANEPLPAWLDPSTPEYLGGTSTTYDWQEEMLNNNAIIEDYVLSVSGGGQGSNYYFSGGYSNQEGTLKYNGVKRYTVSLNSDFQVTDWLKIGETFRTALTQGNDSRSGNLSSVFNTPPWQPIYDPDNRFGFQVVKDEEGNLLYGNETESNHLAMSEVGFRKYNTFRTLGNAYLQLTPGFLPGLSLKGSIGIDFIYNQRKQLNSVSEVPFSITASVGNGSNYGERHARNFNMISEFQINYNKTFGQRHNVDLLFNTTNQEYTFNVLQGSANGIRFEDEDVVTVTPAALGAEANSESFREVRKLAGILARVSYNFDSKYYIDASWRRDGSSVFAPGNRFGNFYGVSMAWRISSESFLSNNDFISDLKLRGSWGQSGNQETRPFGYSANISLNPRYPLNGDDNLAIGSFPINFPVEGLTWEKTTSYNYGLDAAFLDYKLTVTVEYYDKLTDGILRPYNIPITAGINQNPVVNLAEVSNRGIELQLGWQDEIGDFTYSIGGNLTTVKNQVEKLFLESTENDRILVNGNTAIQVGQPINFYYGWQTDGIFQSDTEAESWAGENTDQVAGGMKEAGDFAFLDLFGNPDPDLGEFKSDTPDGQINDFDKTNIGKSIPGFYYGINIGLGFKGFDASLFFQGVGDIQKINAIRWSGESMSSQGLNQWTTVRDRWTPSNPSNTIPRALVNDQVGNTRFSNRWVEDADYLRFANFQFGYTLSNTILQKLKFDNLRIYVSGTNLALFTGYTGLDPEIAASTDENPPPVVWMLGVNATF